ncbi:hypothetical protein LI328DRAFT_162623 [Trichoderma asperelloides]|nr:hypothetical protein LI328DRAFT_162623 [Trichoderma asperelloides]
MHSNRGFYWRETTNIQPVGFHRLLTLSDSLVLLCIIPFNAALELMLFYSIFNALRTSYYYDFRKFAHLHHIPNQMLLRQYRSAFKSPTRRRNHIRVRSSLQISTKSRERSFGG